MITLRTSQYETGERMSNNIIKFPMKGTKIRAWANQARAIQEVTGAPGAKVWISKQVPVQFRGMVTSALKAK